MPTGSDPRLGATLAGFELEALLGRGGMGAVYRADDVRLGRKVALKLLAPGLAEDERFRERFLRESQLAASLDHPNIVPIYAAGEADGQLYLAMRYIDGYDLKRLLATEPRLEPERVLRLLEQVGDALDSAHERGLIHRDVKPGNILIAPRSGHEHAYLADFGLTKQTSSISGLTGTGELVGTVNYVSPEQIRGEAVDGRADVYALGCVLYECLAGQPPFARESEVATLWAHVNDPSPALVAARPELGQEIDGVMARALAKTPADRYQSCGELIASARSALGLEVASTPSAPPRTRRPFYRRPLVIGALAAVLAAAVAIPVFALDSDGGTEALERVQDNAVAVVDPESRKIVGEAPEIASPQRVAAGEGSIWVTSSSGASGSVVRLDPESHDVVDRIEVGGGPVGVAVGGGSVWVANTLDGTVSRIDPAAGRVVDEIDVGNSPTAVAFGAGAVWVTNADDRTVSRIDPVSGEIVGQPIDVEAAARGIAVGDGALWVTDPVGNALVRVDLNSGTLTDRIPVGSGPTAVAHGNGAVWVTNSLDGTVTLIDARRVIEVDTIPVGAAPNGIAAAPDGAWVSDEVDGTLVHVDRASRETTVRTLGGRPEGLTLTDGSLWIAVQAGGAAHRGGRLRLVGEPGAVNSIDPARSFAWEVVSVTHDGLVGFKRVGGSDGSTLVPDLASVLPTPTGDGKTYTFRMRPGIKFSDGRELKASDVRSTFERLFSASGPGTDLASYYAGIVGAPACQKRPKRCDLSQGVVTDDGAGTVTIRLRAPDPEFLYKLALPYVSVVPTGTPSTGDRPVLGTGPYRIAQYQPKRRVRLVRNRHFREWSKAAQPEGFPNEILIEMAGTDDANLTAVQRGRADWLWSFPLDRLQEARTRFAAQFHLSPRLFTLALRLNTKRPPFDDVRARQAVAYAFDRGRLADSEGSSDAVTCQLLPPNVPAYDRYCPYTVTPTRGGAWTAPNLERARRLVAESGTQGMRVDVLGQTQEAGFGTITTILDKTLQQLGYRTSVRRLPENFFRYFDAYNAGAGRVEAAIMGWIGDYPAPSNFVWGLLECSGNPYACDRDIERKLRQTLELQGRNPRAANEAWARLEREAVDQAIIVPVVNPTRIDFVSKRLGNYQNHPLFGMLISQVWVR